MKELYIEYARQKGIVLPTLTSNTPSPSLAPSPSPNSSPVSTTCTTFKIVPSELTYTGTTGNDCFVAGKYFNEPSGTYIYLPLDELAITDAAGTNSATLRLNAGVTLGAISGVQTINLTADSASTVSFENVAGVTAVGSTKSTGALTITNLQSAPTTYSMTNTNVAMSVTPLSTALSGSSDAATININDVNANPTLTITTGVNGYETLTVNSLGSIANSLTLVPATSTSTTTLNIGGAAPLTLVATGGVPSITTVNASSYEGGSTLATGLVVSVPTTTTAITAGSGYEQFKYVGAYPAAATPATITGKAAGTTVVSIEEDGFAGLAASTVTNVKSLIISDQLASGGSYDVTSVATDIKDLVLSYTGALSGGTATIALNAASTVSIGAAGAAATTLGGALTLSTATTGDTLNLNLYGTSDATNGILQGGAGTYTTANITSSTAANKIDSLTIANTGTVNVLGSVGFQVDGAITAKVIDASGMSVATTANGLTMGPNLASFLALPTNIVLTLSLSSSATVSSAAATITGSPGADVLVGTSTYADTINGGAGNDFIFNHIPGVTVTFASQLTGGLGADTFGIFGAPTYAAGATSSAYVGASQTIPTITDFSVSQGDVLMFSKSFANYFGASYTTGANAIASFAAPDNAVAAAGSTIVIGQPSSSTATIAAAAGHLYKMNTPVAAGATILATAASAIGGVIVTSGGATTGLFSCFYDSTNSKAIFGIMSATTAVTAIATGNIAFEPLVAVGMTTTDYANFGATNFEIGF